MGNCSLGGVSDTAKGFNFIRIMTDSGDIMKLKGPKLVGEVLNSFPGYKIFGQGQVSTPLFDHEKLVSGKFYYLLPLGHGQKLDQENENPTAAANEKDPVRMSSAALELVTSLANGSGLEVLPPPQKGVWRVKLAISPRQLEEILSEEVNTEALIEQMRMAAAASSASATPKRTTKGSWGLILKPILGIAVKAPLVVQEDLVKSSNLHISSPSNVISTSGYLNQTSPVS